MRILITGGAGYIGSHCNKHLSQKGVETIVLDNLLFGHRQSVMYGTFVQGDFGDDILLRRLFSQYDFDAVMHFGALADVEDSVRDPSPYYDTNINKMQILLNCMLQNGVTKLIFSSSAATFGEPEYVPVDESHTQVPISPYGFTKLAGEKLLEHFKNAYGLDFVALRYFNASGADLDCEIGESHYPEHHLLPKIYQSILKKDTLFNVYGYDYDTEDGTCVRDFIHVSDIAEAHFLALDYLMNEGESRCFNLGNSKGFTILQIIKACEHTIGKPINFKLCERRKGDPAKLIASNMIIKKILNWNPKFSDIDTIIRTGWQWELDRKY